MVKISGGDKLQARLDEIAKAVTKPAKLQVGFMEGATYKDGRATPIALVAAINEFGAPSRGQPSRPFFRNMVAEKSREWPDTVATLLTDNDYDATKTMMQMGEGIKSQLQQSIVDTNAPPLSPATIAAKGSSKPLVDTGQMLNSVNFKVD